MKTFQNLIPAQAEGLNINPAPLPMLMERVFYSPRGEPVLVASTPVALRSSASGEKGALRWQMAKESLARFLARYLLERQMSDLTLERDPLGKPEMWLGATPGPAISFSWSAGKLWAAVCGSESGLGLDATLPGEFIESYPYQRVFREEEWQAAVTLSAGNREEAASLLWSVKEAVVKAWGCGFHFLSPRQVDVQFAGQQEDCYLWRGCQGSSPGSPPVGREACPAVTVRLREVWLAVAWGR